MDFKFINTSVPEQTPIDLGTGEDLSFEGNDENVEQQPVTTDQDQPEGNDNVKSAFLSWAEETGFEVDETLYTDDMTEDEMQEEVSRLYAMSYLERKAPHLLTSIVAEASPEDVAVAQQAAHYLTFSPDNMSMTFMYHNLVDTMLKDGSLELNEDGDLSPEDVKDLAEVVRKRYNAMSDDKKNDLHQRVRQHYEKQKDLPLQKAQQVLMQRQEEERKSYESNVQKFTAELNKELSKGKNARINFLKSFDETERQDFINYTQKQLQYNTKTGRSNLLDRLASDGEFLADLVHLMFLKEKGYFTDIKNGARKEAFNKLSPVPRTGNRQSAPPTKSRFVDTSKPHK